MSIPITSKEWVFRGTVVASYQNQAIVNVFHYRYTGALAVPPPDATLDNLADAFREAWRTLFLPEVPETYAVQFYHMDAILGRIPKPPNVVGPPWIVHVGPGIALERVPGLDEGTSVTTVPAESFVCATVRHRSNNRRRWANGSAHYGPVRESYTSGNLLTDPAQVVYQNISTGMGQLDAGEAAAPYPMTMTIFSATRLLNEVAVPTSAYDYCSDVVSRTANKLVGSMLKRKQTTLLN